MADQSTHSPYHDKSNFRLNKPERRSLVLVVILGLCITFFTSFVIHHKEQQHQQRELEKHAHEYLSQLDKAVHSNIENLQSIRGLYLASNFVDRNEFRIFTKSVFQAHDEIHVLQWVPEVSHENRWLHEDWGRQDGIKNYQILEKNSAGSMQVAQQRNIYYPVTYIEPLSGNEANIGFDLLSDITSKTALEQARDSGWPVAAEEISLAQGDDEKFGFLVFLPVYDVMDELLKIDARRQHLKGFVSAVFRIDVLFKTATENIQKENLKIVIEDLTPPDRSVTLLVYNESDHTITGASDLISKNIQSSAVRKYSAELLVANRQWRLSFIDTQGLAGFGYQAVLTFFGGLLFTAFVTSYLLGSSRRRLLVELMVDERTRELKLLKEEMENILENTGEGIYGMDLNGYTTFANKASTEITGFSIEEMLGKSQHELIHHHYPDGTEYPRNKCNVYAAIRTGKISRADQEVFWHKDGHSIPVEYTSTPIFDDNNNIQGAVVIFHDISQRKKYEQELISARYKAEEASRAKTDFLATMSHEIRTPMNGMLGMANLLADTELDETQKEYIETLLSSGKALLSQINAILDFSRIEADKLKLDIVFFDLEKMSLELVQLMKSQAEDKGIVFELNYPADCPKYVSGDNLRIRQVLLNLIGNAIKFTREGSVQLNIKHEILESQQARFCMEVRDSGIGIESDVQSTLFDAFTQADASTTREYGGSGLGLAICKKLSNLMGGDILVSSEPGKGSCFQLWLTLPLVDASKINAGGNTIKESCKFSGRILLVEDNRVNQKVAESILKKLGLNVVIADHGEMAVDLFTDDHFDLVLMDCQMPVMDGYQATRTIRKMAEGKNVAVIALTANVLPDDMNKCIEAGMNGCLHKPIDMDELQQELKKWLPYEVSEKRDALINSETVLLAGMNTIDFNHLDQLAGIMGELFKELIPAYIEACDLTIEETPGLLDNGNFEALHRHYHSMKSSSRNVGANDLALEAEKMEEQARNGELDAFKLSFDAIKNHYQQVKQALIEYNARH